MNCNMRSCIITLLKLSNYTCKNNLNIRQYARWTHRRPVKVLTPEEYYSQEIKTGRHIIQPQNLEETHSQFNKPPLKNAIKEENLIDIESLDAKTHFLDKTKQKKQVKYTEDEVLNTTFDENGNYVYSKMKNNDSKIGQLLLTVKSRKLRKKEDSILLEGKRLIRDALLAKCTVQHVLFSRKPDLDYIKDLLPKKNVRLYKLAYRDLQMWSDLKTSPGIMGIFKTPKENELSYSGNVSLPLTIICDNIREPGNLGAILRASAAVGSQQILLTKGCVDLWEPKVLRSSCGAHFRSPIYKNLDWAQIQARIPKLSSIFLADNNVLTTLNESKENLKHLCVNVPMLPYFSVKFSDYSSIVLIIGGETVGLSEESYKFAFENGGSRLNIPLNNNIESLNTGTALGIIAFEIKRQLLLIK